MDCPKCKQPLAERREGLFEDIVVYGCSCGGTFYPAGALDRLDDNVGVNAETLEYDEIDAQSGRPMTCPQCHSASGYRDARGVELVWHELVLRPDVQVAICPSCDGFWMQEHTFERLCDAVLHRSEEENARMNASEIDRVARRRKKGLPPNG
jgi:Zn-finger nucleic acid-binding protein